MFPLINILKKKALMILLVWLFLLSFLYSALAIIRHDHFQSGGFDLGLYDQGVWQYSKLLKPYNTIKERHLLGDHLTLTLPLLAPLYWLWDDVRMLLIFQAFWLSFSALAVFKLCQKRKFPALTSLILSFGYSLFYGLQYLVFFDFHPVAIGVGLLPWLVLFLETQRKKAFLISLILFLLTQENMGLALASLGFCYLFQKKYRRLAMAFILGGFSWSLLASRIIASFSPIGFQYWPDIDSNPLKIIAAFFNSEEKRLTWLYSLSWFSFLPFFSIGSMLAVCLDLGQYFVTGPEFARMWSPFMHHRGILAPFLFLGAMEILAKLKRRKISLTKISLFLFISFLAQQYFFHLPLNKLSKPFYWREEAWMKNNRLLINQIPPNASLAAQQNLVPHLSHRREIYLAWPREHDFEPPYPGAQKSGWWLDFGGRPEYLLVDLRPHQWLTQILESNENFQAAVKNMARAGRISLEKENGDIKLYRLNYQP